MPFHRRYGQTERARELRQQENPAEASMWTALKDRKLGGHKFVRQLPLGSYYADFVCRSAKLIVEIDGSQHVGSAYDQRRDAYMSQLGYAVLRLPSSLVLRQRAEVCDTILAVLEGRVSGSVEAVDMKYTHPSPGAPRRPLP
jgi:very-short-patch-repair endonuclease